MEGPRPARGQSLPVCNLGDPMCARDEARACAPTTEPTAPAHAQVGDVGVIKFGDRTGSKVLHELDQPLSDDAAARVLAQFSFRGEGLAPAGQSRAGDGGKVSRALCVRSPQDASVAQVSTVSGIC